MKARISWALLLLCLCFTQGPAVAQKAPAQRTVEAVVVDAHTDPARPVPTVRVSLGYLDGSVLVTEARDVTNPKGQAWLDVSEDAAERGGLRIEVEGANNLVIYQPADGQLPVLPATINVSMLPKGSPALLGPAQIEAMLHRTLLLVSSLQKQVAAMRQNTAVGQNQNPDLGAAISAWAQTNGFSAAQVNQQVEQWAERIQRQSAQATAEQKALAELALNHYAKAAQLFKDASDTDSQEVRAGETQEQALEAQVKALQAAQQAVRDKLRTLLRQLLDHSQQAAGAFQLDLQYHQATQTLESAVANEAAEYKKYPDDKGLHELWLQAFLSAANARREEGEVAPADQSLPLLAQTADDFQLAAREDAALGNRQEGAGAEAGLGAALTDEGIRVGGEKSAALLEQAAEAYQKALEIRTRADLPVEWAATETNLGTTLAYESQRVSGENSLTLLDQAIHAYQNALGVYTKTDHPQDWARTQAGLGMALAFEGLHAGGQTSGLIRAGSTGFPKGT
jgi:chemotaxis protein histidine kinase CheA